MLAFLYPAPTPTRSGHNSYLQGNQLTSTAGTQTIEIGLRHGCRVVELDVYDGPTEPVRAGWMLCRRKTDTT